MTIGVYVHFPWCLKKCPYCDFVSFAEERGRIDHRGYADAVLAELRWRAPALEGRVLGTVFFGGGTPSLWEPSELGRVLAAIRDALPRTAADVVPLGPQAAPNPSRERDVVPLGPQAAPNPRRWRDVVPLGPQAAPNPRRWRDVEVTVECNPTSIDEARALAFRAVGANRLSIGVQGLDAGRLAFLGRLHDPDGGLEALRAALRAGVPRVSGDLIYGVGGGLGGAGGQTAADAAEEARRIAATGVTHVSAYSLTIEPGTQFGELARRGRLPTVPDDAVAEAFFAIDEALADHGLEHYEVSNYARPGDEARHNLGYWRGDDYLALGCAAYGTLSAADGSAVRYRNTPDPRRYMAAALEGTPLVDSEERLDAETRLRERIMLGLRLREGLDLEAAAAALGAAAWTDARRRAAERLVSSGRLEIDGGRLRLPKRAWVFADGVAAALF